jgi:hypothetical protein
MLSFSLSCYQTPAGVGLVGSVRLVLAQTLRILPRLPAYGLRRFFAQDMPQDGLRDVGVF